jgi:glycosyltransferase involved in cell wall biosynthesis
MPSFDYFDEIWCPSNFVTEAVSLKAPFSVITMPHSIGFTRPAATTVMLRRQFGLPLDRFLFLCLFDLNSYTARKNPRAAIEAFRKSGLAGGSAALVIKVHNAEANQEDFAALNEAVRDLPGTVVIGHTLSRTDVYGLEAACDCFVSLHRSEGFGFAVAECMYLGKPVIATGWSAPAEYLDCHNGYPVNFDLVKLTENHGPYTKGSSWADPDIENAAAIMAQVLGDPNEAARKGEAARQTIEQRFSPAVIGARYRRRLEVISGT